MRPIDADALKDVFNEQPPEYYTTAYVTGLIDRMPTVGSWISVNDRLPDIQRVDYLGESWGESNEVLVYVKDVPENFRHIYVAYICEGVWRSDDDYWFNDYTVTHWMPLPEAPSKEERHG